MSKATAKRMSVVVVLLLTALSLFLGQLWYHLRLTAQLIDNRLYTAEVRQDVRYFIALLIANWLLILLTILAVDRLWAWKHKQEKDEPRMPPRS